MLNKAIEEFNKVIEINPGFAAACSIRGIAYAQKGGAAKACADARKVQQLGDNIFSNYLQNRDLYE